VRLEPRSKFGFEVDISVVRVVGAATHDLPFHAGQDLAEVGQDVVLLHRPLSLRNDRIRAVFRVQAAILDAFREFLRGRRFTEIVTSKIVGGGTEGGANLFRVDYFDRVAYLAQSPQFFKEHGVAGLERVFETGHVYRAEPHATVRHLTEYYSLDLEMGFIDGPEDVIALERDLLVHVFERLSAEHAPLLRLFGKERLPDLSGTPTWEFGECLDRLRRAHQRSDLVDDLDPDGERQLCALAERECGVPAVFVLGFPLSGRPFYTHPRGTGGAAQSFDLLFRGLEITTGGQRLHTRADLEASLRSRGVDPAGFEAHLRMFDLGMPPHGGLAIGLERLTAQVLGLANIREATLYPRDRTRIAP
jgi:nondiscriminating aspartyl-tRNA synthetase